MRRAFMSGDFLSAFAQTRHAQQVDVLFAPTQTRHATQVDILFALAQTRHATQVDVLFALAQTRHAIMPVDVLLHLHRYVMLFHCTDTSCYYAR